MSKTLKPGQTIGILGGGQLGRMLAVAASRLGFKTHIFDPNSNAVASQVSNTSTIASFDNSEALNAFSSSVDVITFEFENIPTEALAVLEKKSQIFPPKKALSVSQDRLVEKNFLNTLDLNTAPYENVENQSDLEKAIKNIGTPSILKTRRFGYDGKGQVKIDSENNSLADVWQKMNQQECILEGFVPFIFEVSVIAARSIDGKISFFDPGENIHKEGILRTTSVPSNLSEVQIDEAYKMVEKILIELEYVGVMGVEFFVTKDNLLINEIAPRVHNSGHWTQNACSIDQFEQHIRAVAGLSLGDGLRHSDVQMSNLIGNELHDVNQLLKDPMISLHLYGKEEVREGRKMGHFNKIVI